MTDVWFPGNAKLIGWAWQTDKDSPAAEPDIFFKVTGYQKSPPRAQGPYEETDSLAQQGANHVTAFTPACTFDLYGRPSLLPTIAEMVLWDAHDDVTNGIIVVTPSQVPRYGTLWEIEPGLYTDIYDGVIGVAASFVAQDEGQTELRVNGLQLMSLGFTAHQAEPELPDLSDDEEAFLYAEATIKYAGVHPGTTRGFTWNVTRNATRVPGDNGFRSLGIPAGKLQNDGSITRVVQEDGTKRAVETGSKTGTDMTTAIYDEAIEIKFDRPDDNQSFAINSEGIAYVTREQAVNTDGAPLGEVLGFQTQPQADVADNVTITCEV